MRIIRSITSMQRLALEWKRGGFMIGFVPTMGCLHDGHMHLVREARRRTGAGGKVVVSIFVNPTQFGPKEDFKKYPRTWETDRSRCDRAGVDVLFAPSAGEMYPVDPRFSTFVKEETLSASMEGLSRPGHFQGVTTVVAKLFNIVLPDVAVFGAKDFQQAAVVRRMIRDLNFPVKLVVAPTVRERDGVAMSSRNRYLSEDERRRARVLRECLKLARARVRSSRGIAADELRNELKRRIEDEPGVELDYIAFFDPDTLEPVEKVRRGVRMALAARVGGTRLIDNDSL